MFTTFSRVFVWTLVACVLCACSGNDPSAPVEETVRLGAPEAQSELINGLKQKGLKFRVDDAGFVVYALSDREALESLASSLRAKYFPTDSVLFETPNDEHRAEFLRLLEHAKIPVREITRDGKVMVIVPISHGGTAKAIWRQAFELTFKPPRQG